ncbi:MAG: glycosyltransferase family 4 protein [Cyanobacteria bacterium]|nr:glycosyltransferase family 4 protein [Cyanobacteriota bacterium]MDW8202967.1 glycosyltransferase family 1 protein [Cyanobacteriota bacterium SKYGB_h_bin112]
MRVLYDGLVYTHLFVGGINRYFNNLISHLPATVTPTVMACYGNPVTAIAHPRLRLCLYRSRLLPSRISGRFGAYYFRWVTAQTRPDIIHPTYYSLLTNQAFARVSYPLVITVWDMITERFAADLDPLGTITECKRQAVHAAQAILCISEHTRQDLLERYPHLEAKTTVTYLATDLHPSMVSAAPVTPRQPYLLYVGGRRGYKNFDGLLQALAVIVQNYRDLTLCVVGSPFSAEEQAHIAALRLGDRIHHAGLVDDRCLATLYHHSLALVYPSLYEGFGIPPLEAMVCGTVAIAANCASIPEVVGDAGLLFDPKQPDELIDQLLWVLNNPSERDRLIAKGQQRASQFSWQKTAAETMAVYQSLCDAK